MQWLGKIEIQGGYMEIVNTQSKVYNHVRRTYIDEKDCKEGELICPKCDGGGSWPKKFAKLEDPSFLRCHKCQGIGIIDWIEKVVGKPAIMTGGASSSSSTIMYGAGIHGTSGISYNAVKSIPMPGNVHIKQGTNYKRRTVV